MLINNNYKEDEHKIGIDMSTHTPKNKPIKTGTECKEMPLGSNLSGTTDKIFTANMIGWNVDVTV